MTENACQNAISSGLGSEYLAATKVRRALEEIHREYKAQGIHCLPLDEFPRGSCGEVSKLLATYFRDHGCGIFRYFCGVRRGKSHAWLQKDDIIADITADQFRDQNSSVIVTKDRAWHSKFKIAQESTALFDDNDDGFAVPTLRQLYRQMLLKIAAADAERQQG